MANIATTTLKNLDDYFADAPLENEICYRCLGSGGANKSDCPHRANGRCHSVTRPVISSAHLVWFRRYTTSVKFAPSPGFDETMTSPPCSWAMCLTMARPSPVPPRDRLRSVSMR